MSESTGRQAEYKKAIEAHIDLKNGLMLASDCIQDACNRLQSQQRQDGLILQHAAISLHHVNQEAARAILNTLGFAERMVKETTQHTVDLNTLIRMIPEPPPPPADEPPADDEPEHERMVIKDTVAYSTPDP